MSPRNTAKADIVLKISGKTMRISQICSMQSCLTGNKKPHPEDLREADVDLSSVLKFNGHIETIQRLRDVVKKDSLWNGFCDLGVLKTNRKSTMQCH